MVIIESIKVVRCICANCGRIWTARYGKLPAVCRFCKVKSWNRDARPVLSGA